MKRQTHLETEKQESEVELEKLKHKFKQIKQEHDQLLLNSNNHVTMQDHLIIISDLKKWVSLYNDSLFLLTIFIQNFLIVLNYYSYNDICCFYCCYILCLKNALTFFILTAFAKMVTCKLTKWIWWKQKWCHRNCTL